ncbi:MAG: diadenylate cyclase [Desulfobacterales bacterium]
MPLLNYIPVPTWRDFIDILFLTLVAYQLYQWFSETRALRVLIGLVLLGGIYSIAKLWGLFLTTWVFQILWQVLLILLLILFQSEIRQVLEKVSPLRYLRSRRRVFRATFAKDLAQVLFDLAAEKIGALVVLTRDDNPSEFIHAGQKIMALPDSMLIKSIFNQHAPAHDGAIILSQDRLTHMRCILPLSKRENLPEHYGTRHRAALGLSELTDSVCLVVSEERSEVSSVVAGEISIWSDPQELEKNIKTWLEDPEIRVPTIQHFIEDLIVKNWKAKLSAFALVFAAWLILASQQDIKITVNAPIRYVNPAGELIVGEGSSKAVDLTLSGRQGQINALRDQDVRVDVDLSQQLVGKRMITLSGKNVQLPLGVNVLRITPQKIEVNLKPPTKD